MNKLISRLMLASATMALAAAIVPIAANANVVAPSPPCMGDGGCPVSGMPWTVTSGTAELISPNVYSPSSLTVDGAGTPGVIVDPGATLNDDAIVGDASFGTFTNNGSHNVTGNLILGNQSGGIGSYTITGDSAVTNVNFNTATNPPVPPSMTPTPAETPNGALIVGNAGAGTFNQGTDSSTDPDNQVNVAGDLVLGHQNTANSQGTYNLNSGALTVGGQLSVGGASLNNNIFNQYSGSVTLTNSASTNPLYAGAATGVFTGKLAIGGGIDQGGNDGGNGTYNLFGGSIDTTANGIEVGPSGTGVMNQFGGTVNTTFLTMGFSGNGTYNLSGDNSSTVTAVAETVGYAGTGNFNQSGGVNTIGLNSDGSLQNPGAIALEVGLNCCGNSPGNGTYTLTGGTLNTGNMVVGDGEQGTFVQSPPIDIQDPTVNVTGNLTVGGAAGGTGSYSITGDQSTLNVLLAPGGNGVDGMGNPNPNGALIVGDAGTGSFVQGGDPSETTGPTVNVAGDLVLGHQSGSQGTYTLNFGALTVGGTMIVGAASTNNNVFTQNGGTVNVTGSASGNSDYVSVNANAVPGISPGSLYVGGESIFDNGTGTYNLAGGSLTAGNLFVGFSGTGTVNQSGGTANVSFVDLGGCGGCNGGNSAGFYNLTGNGTLTTSALNVGDFGHGEFTQGADFAGNTVVTVNGTLAIGNGATATPNSANPMNYDRSGTYTLDSGTLTTNYTIVGNVGTGTFIQNGGTHAITNTLTIGAQNSQPLSGPAGSGTDSNPVFGGPAPGTYTMTGGTVTANGDQSTGNDTSGAGIIVGDAGNGTFNQIGGSVTSGVLGGQRGDLLIGAQAGSTGNYNLGDSTNSSPTLQVYGDATIGRDAAANGTLTIAGDGTAMNVNQYTDFVPQNGGNMLVGLNGTGAVTQTDQSSLYLDHYLVLGVNSGSSGSYTLSATSTTANSGYNLFVGSDLDVGGYNPATDIYGYNPQTTANGGTGTFTQTSGDVFVVGSANIGNSGGTGTYTLSGGTLTSGNDLNIGNNGTGTFSQSGGTVTATGLAVGNGGSGEYDLSGGTLTASQAVVGAFGPSVGTFNQTGGTFNASFLNVGILAGGVGTYTMSAGNLNVAGDLGLGGPNAQGTFTQSNGTVQAGGLFVNNDNEGTSGGSYSISGGSLTVSGPTSYIGNGADDGTATAGAGGVFTQTGGQVTFSNTLDIGIGLNSSGPGEMGSVCPANPSPCIASGAYTMSGGTASIATLNVGGGSAGSTGTFTMNANPSDSPAPNPALDPLVNTTSLTIATGGTVQINGGLMTVGATSTFGEGGSLNVGSAGTASVLGGSLSVANTLNVGIGGGSALFTQTGGSVTVGSNLILGNAPGENGTYNLTGGGATAVGGFTFFGNGGTGTFLNDASTDNTQELVLGHDGGSSGTYTLQNGGALTVGTSGTTGFFDVGEHGTGVFNQTSGTTIVYGSLDLGRCGSATGCLGTTDTDTGIGNGTVNLSGGSLSVSQFAVVGDSGIGAFTQSGGSTVTTGGELDIGRNGGTGTYNLGDTASLTVGSNATGGSIVLGNAGSSGTFNLSGSGSVTVTAGTDAQTGTIFDGTAGTGMFTQSDTSTVSATNVSVGNNTGGVGTYNLSGGTLTLSNELFVGGAGQGTFTQSGASSTVTTGFLSVGNNAGGVGNYNLSAGSLTAFADTFLGGDNLAQGTITQTGGTAALDGNVNVGFASGATGTYTLGGSGAATIGANLDIGVAANSSGTFNFNTAADDAATLAFTTSGSTLTVGDAGSGTFNQGGGDLNLAAEGVTLDIGAQKGSNGTYNLTGGSLEDGLIVGDAGTGSFSNSGGSHSVTGNLVLGNQATGNGTYNLSGTGTLTVSGDAVVGAAGHGDYEQTGGTASVTGAMTLGDQSTGSGTANISGGSLGLGSLVIDNANTTTASSMTISGTGAVTATGAVTVNASGTPNGSSLTVNGGSLTAASVTNNDTLNVNGGTVTAPVTNNLQFNLQGGTVAGSVTNNGTTDTSSGGTATVTGAFNNTSTGTTSITGNSTLAVGGSVMNANIVTVANGSKLSAGSYTQSGGTTTVDGQIAATNAVVNGGMFTGTGTIDGNLSNTAGTVKPGDGAPGTMSVTGTYNQEVNAIFEAGISGTNSDQVSKLAVGGAATLSGTLDVDLLNGFQVADGETFNIMSFASSIGDFTNFELNGSDCTAGGADIYNCSGLPSGLFFEEQFVNNDTGLDLVVGETGGGGGTPVPEPWTIALFAAGLAGLTAMRRRFKAKTS